MQIIVHKIKWKLWKLTQARFQICIHDIMESFNLHGTTKSPLNIVCHFGYTISLTPKKWNDSITAMDIWMNPNAKCLGVQSPWSTPGSHRGRMDINAMLAYNFMPNSDCHQSLDAFAVFRPTTSASEHTTWRVAPTWLSPICKTSHQNSFRGLLNASVPFAHLKYIYIRKNIRTLRQSNASSSN